MSVLKELINANDGLDRLNGGKQGMTPTVTAAKSYRKDMLVIYNELLDVLDKLEDFTHNRILSSREKGCERDYSIAVDVLHHLANNTNRLLSIG